MKYSLSHRLIFAAVVLLAAFVAIAAFALNAVYEKRAMAALETQLLGHVYTLLSAVDEDEKGLIRLAELVPDPRLNQTDSGLYAVVQGHGVDFKWQSASTLGFTRLKSLQNQAKPGQVSYRQTDGLMVLDFGVAWDDLDGQSWNYTISVASSLADVRQDLQQFRQGLIYWLGSSAILLLLVQVAVLRWGLKPLKQAAEDVKRVESGQIENLQGKYPDELTGLTDNINSLLKHGQANQQRYRNSLGDLAHSLKTPLALLQAAREQNNIEELNQTLDDQLPRIDDLVQYHLQRASVMGKTTLAQAIVLKPVVEKIVSGLDKVYQDKQVKTELLIDEDTVFHGDLADLMELLGNLLDNAYKYGNSQIIVSAQKHARLTIKVEDDGPGIDRTDWQHLLQRGVRADQKLPGQGIGLGVVNEIVALYNAGLTIGQSELGGALFIVKF